jgi:hypothetical protein
MQSGIDDLPVGGGSNKGPSASIDEFGSAAENKVDNSGPLEQRIVSKNWLVRANAFEELCQMFKTADSSSDMVFRDHASTWKKYLADNNPGSLEKCLDALNVFVDRGDPKVVNQS